MLGTTNVRGRRRAGGLGEQIMAVAVANATAAAPRLRVVSPLSIEAELACLMCGRTVGEIVEGRVVQHADCGGRLRVERGLIRCCHCNGPVYKEPMMALSPR
jgi:hypothetical protein